MLHKINLSIIRWTNRSALRPDLLCIVEEHWSYSAVSERLTQPNDKVTILHVWTIVVLYNVVVRHYNEEAVISPEILQLLR